MSRSPNDYFNEAEAKVNKLSLGSEARYSQALSLYKNAAIGFKNAHNFLRAAEAYRRVVDCYFHLDEQKEAGDNAIEAARLFAKAPNAIPKMKEIFDIGISTLIDLGEVDECGKYLVEFSKVYETAKRFPDSIDCLQRASEIYFDAGREFDSTKIDQQIGSTLVNLMKWDEATNHFALFASRLTKVGTTAQINDACAKAVLCRICASGPTLATTLFDKLGNEILSWKNSQEYTLVKEILDASHARLESRVTKAAENYKHSKTCDKTMNDILGQVMRKAALH